MHVEVFGDLFVDLDEELLELSGPVVLAQRPDHLAARHVQGGKQRGGAVANVVVTAAFGGAWHHRQDRLEAVERLDLGLLVDAEHDGALRRVEVKPDHVADLLDEVGVGRKLETLGPVGLEPEGPPDPVDRAPAQVHLFGHRSRRPVGGVFGLILQGLDDHRFDLVVADLPRRTGAGIVGQAIEAVLDEATTPLADHGLAHPELGGDLAVGRAFLVCTALHDAGPHGHRLRALAPVGQPLERESLLGAQDQLGLRPSLAFHGYLHRG
jgi:hypothetical protein